MFTLGNQSASLIDEAMAEAEHERKKQPSRLEICNHSRGAKPADTCDAQREKARRVPSPAEESCQDRHSY